MGEWLSDHALTLGYMALWLPAVWSFWRAQESALQWLDRANGDLPLACGIVRLAHLNIWECTLVLAGAGVLLFWDFPAIVLALISRPFFAFFRAEIARRFANRAIAYRPSLYGPNSKPGTLPREDQ